MLVGRNENLKYENYVQSTRYSKVFLLCNSSKKKENTNRYFTVSNILSNLKKKMVCIVITISGLEVKFKYYLKSQRKYRCRKTAVMREKVKNLRQDLKDEI